MFMNEYDIEDALRRFSTPATPNLERAAHALWSLMGWVNANSDGWPYWSKPIRAAARLQALLQGVDRIRPQDVTEAEVRKALTPVRSFLTRQGVDSRQVLGW